MDDRQRLEIELSAPIDGDWTWGELEDQAREWYGLLHEAQEAMERLGPELAQAYGTRATEIVNEVRGVGQNIRQQLSPEEESK